MKLKLLETMVPALQQWVMKYSPASKHHQKLFRSPTSTPLSERAVMQANGSFPSYAWACGPPIGMKIVSSLRLYDRIGVERRRPGLLWMS